MPFLCEMIVLVSSECYSKLSTCLMTKWSGDSRIKNIVQCSDNILGCSYIVFLCYFFPVIINFDLVYLIELEPSWKILTLVEFYFLCFLMQNKEYKVAQQNRGKCQNLSLCHFFYVFKNGTCNLSDNKRN